MSEAPWSLNFTARVKRDLRRLDRPISARVVAALERLAKEPRSDKLSKLTGRPESRLRVGDWRVLVELDENTRTIIVKQVLPRGRVYDR
ncbi:MAG: type II toxin-antitoxin system RelE family toxin [Solirubrobacteraceae bacterium]